MLVNGGSVRKTILKYWPCLMSNIFSKVFCWVPVLIRSRLLAALFARQMRCLVDLILLDGMLVYCQECLPQAMCVSEATLANCLGTCRIDLIHMLEIVFLYSLLYTVFVNAVILNHIYVIWTRIWRVYCRWHFIERTLYLHRNQECIFLSYKWKHMTQ